MPTLTQLAPLLRLFGPAAVALIAPYVGAGPAETIVSALLTLAGAGAWSLYANTPASLAQTVASVKGVTVHVDPSADPSLQKLAADDKVKDIVPAPAAPNMYSSQRSKS